MSPSFVVRFIAADKAIASSSCILRAKWPLPLAAKESLRGCEIASGTTNKPAAYRPVRACFLAADAWGSEGSQAFPA